MRDGKRRRFECPLEIIAYSLITTTNLDMNVGVNVDGISSVDVGDIFSHQHQMFVGGLHHCPNEGIDYGF